MPRRPWPTRWRCRLQDLLLLPLAVLVIVLEDVLWRSARMLLHRIVALPAVVSLRDLLRRLPGWAALPLFLVPELAARIGDLWMAILLYHGRVALAVLVLVVVRLLATLVAVFIWQACAPALLRLAWFARIVSWIERARDWGWRRTAPWRASLWRFGTQGERGLLHRLHRLRDALLRRSLSRDPAD